jgi:hypothetical protein
MRAAGVLVVIGLVFAAAPASAETESADKLFVEGRDLLKRGDPASLKAACEKFHAANALSPLAAGVMLNLGLCYEKLGKLATSLRWYRKAQTAASEAKPQTPDDQEYETAAKERKAELATKVATLKVDVSGLPPEVDVLVDGTRISREELASSVEVDAGEHTVEARAPGKTPFTETLTVEDGGVKNVAIPALADLPVVPVTPVKSNRKRNGVILAVGGAAALGGSLAINLILQSKVNDGSFDAGNGKNIMRFGGTGLFVAGVAGVGIGAYLLFTKGKTDERSTAVAPVVTQDQLGFAVSGSF